MGSFSPPKLPVIDFSKEDLKPGTTSWVSTGKHVLNALERYGCFVAEYDKVSFELYESLFVSLRELFDLPLETKQKNVSEVPFHGFIGRNQPFIPPLIESMGISNATTLEGTRNFTNLMWPNGHDDFCKIVMSYTKIVGELEEMVTKMVFESYGVGKEKYECHKERNTFLFRMMKYRVPKEGEGELGCDVHTDKGFLTVLHQNHVTGLEVLTKEGHWIAFEPSISHSSFVVMAGDVLLAWSNERIHAPFHRVVMSAENEEERYSVGLFSYMKGIIQVPEELVDDDQHPLRFSPFDNFGLLRYFSQEGWEKESAIKAYCGI